MLPTEWEPCRLLSDKMQWTSAGWLAGRQAGRLANVDLAPYIVTMNAAETQTKRTIHMALSRGKVTCRCWPSAASIHYRRQLLLLAYCFWGPVCIMDQEVRPGRCKSVDWLLNSSRDHFGLHWGKNGRGTIYGGRGPEMQFSRLNQCIDMVQRVFAMREARERWYGRKRQGLYGREMPLEYCFLRKNFGGTLFSIYMMWWILRSKSAL